MNLTLTIIYIIVISGVSILAFQNKSLLSKLLMNPYRVHKQNQYYRFITSGFVHGSIAHLFFNMFTFFYFGFVVEDALGPILFTALLLLGIVVSDIPSFLKYKNVPHYNSLGASGGVSAILFCSILYNPMNPIGVFPIPFYIKGFIFGILYLAYSYYAGKQNRDNINHDAHLFGALFGLAFGFAADPELAQAGIQQIMNWRPF